MPATTSGDSANSGAAASAPRNTPPTQAEPVGASHALNGASGGHPRLPARYVREFAPLLTGSAAMLGIKALVEAIADTDATVLIRGESGVGKDIVARAIHEASPRHGGPFVKVNCAALPAGLLESELFGHEKGAFTGAFRRKLGQFEYANRGTILLDEIGELPLALQAKLLHVLQDLAFARIGGQELIKIDARVVAATNRDLEQALARGEFREDLFYRLNVVEIRIPPLRERREEVEGLARLFLDRFNAQYRRDKQISTPLMASLVAHRWPGNVRELENVVRRIALLPEGELAPATLFRGASANGSGGAQGAQYRAAPTVEGLREISRRGAGEAERKALAEVLERVGWNRAEAGRLLKVSYKTLLHKIAEYGLTPPRKRQ